MARISVLLPYRNAAATLVGAVESVLAQEGPPLEVLAIDDGSSDGGDELVRALAARDPRLRMLSSGGEGLVAALELGRAHARGGFIARMDADDIALPGRLTASAALLASDRRLAAVGTQVELFPAEGIECGMERYVRWQNGVIGGAAHRRERFVESPLCHPSVIMRGKALEVVGGYRSGDFPEDYELWLRFMDAGWRIDKVPKVLHRWRHGQARASFNDPRSSEQAVCDLKAQHLAPVLKRDGRPVVVWGTGPVGRRFARALKAHGVSAAGFIDVDPRQAGGTARALRKEGPELAGEGDVVALVAVEQQAAREEIRAAFEQRGRREGRDFFAVA